MPSPRTPEPDFETLAKAVDGAAAAVAGLADGPRRAAEDLRAAIEAAHRAALVTIVRRLREDEAGRALLYELVDDPLIRLLFSLHGIIRPAPGTAAPSAPAASPAFIPLGAVRHRDETAVGLRESGCSGCGA
jgi:hypothetical protein